MTGTAIFVLLAVLLALPAPRAAARDESTLAPPQPLEADREQLRQVMLDHRIETGRPTPGVGLYARDAGFAFNRWLAGWLDFLQPRFARLLGPLTEPILKLLLALVAVALLVLLIRFGVLRWRRRATPAAAPVRRLDAAGEAPPALAPHWEAELRRHLEKGDAAAAAEALWWWLASFLVGERAEASWTSRELIARAGRRDLKPGVRRLDRLIYGAGRPRTEEVGRLWRDLREAVG